MQKKSEYQQIEDFLVEAGLSQVAATLQRASDRPEAHVWYGNLLTRSGDAELELLVYPLGDNPALLANYEEELSYLQTAARKNPLAVKRVAVFDGQTSEYGIIVTATPQEAQIVLGILQSGADDETGMQADLTYHPQLDRLFGGDFIQQMEGRWVQASLLSVERAQRLYQALLKLDKAYGEMGPESSNRKERPFPVPLVVFQLERYPVTLGGESREVPIKELFTTGSLAAAPPAYHELALMQSIIPGIETLIGHPPAVDLSTLASQLFQIIGCGHRSVQATFSRAAGCCLRPEFITPKGELIDLYFFTCAENELTPRELAQYQDRDLFNAFHFLWEAASAANSSFEHVLTNALAAYLNTGKLPQTVLFMASETARWMKERSPGSIKEAAPLNDLSRYILRNSS